MQPMSLRAQLWEVGRRRVNSAWAAHIQAPDTMVTYLASRAFLENWPQGDDTAVIRAVHHHLANNPFLPDSVPGIFLTGKPWVELE